MTIKAMIFGTVCILTVLGCKNPKQNTSEVVCAFPDLPQDTSITRHCNFTDINGNVLNLRYDSINNWVEIVVDHKYVILPYIDTQESGSFKDDVYEFINAGDEVRLLKEEQLIFTAPFDR